MLGGLLGGVASGLLGGLGSAASNAMQWAYSKEAAKLQFEHQKQLNIQSNELSKDYTKWLNTEGQSLMRQGLEKAGYNPMLAVNASPSSGSISGGSASMPNVPNSDIGASGINAYKVFKLEQEKNKAEIDLLKSQAKNIDKDTSLKEFDKPLKLIGDLINNPDDVKNHLDNLLNHSVNVKNRLAGFKGYVDTNAKNLIENSGVKGLLSRGFWSYGDFVNDLSSYLEDKFKGNNIPFKYYKGLSKNNRIKNGVYNYKQLLKMKGRK